MWEVVQHRRLARRLRRLPAHVLDRYTQWVAVVRVSGPEGLRLLPGLRDEALSGEWEGHRSSRLNLQYRVIYRIERDEVQVQVIDVNAHDYRRR